MKDIGISGGCGGSNYCPDASTLRQEAAVFFLKAKWCPLNASSCAYAPPACTRPPNQRFADVSCPSQYADWIEELADEGITSGCGSGNFCPMTPVGTFNMLAWAAAIWPTYNPLPRDAVLTYRDQDAHVITEAQQQSSTGDNSENLIASRDNIFLGSQLVASGIWSGSTWTTLGYNFYASDHLGTPRLVTDIGANLVQLRKFWPYGDDGPSSGSESFQRLKLAGMERDSESKNYYDHARVENFNIGRFISPDKLGGRPRDPQSWNRYAYARNNPIKLVDPNGKYFVLANEADRAKFASALSAVSLDSRGRAMIQSLAADKRPVLLQNTRIESPENVGKGSHTLGLTTPNGPFTTPGERGPLAQSATVSVDFAKIADVKAANPGDPGLGHVDPQGIAVTGHEVLHTYADFNQGIGEALAQDAKGAAPDISEAEMFGAQVAFAPNDSENGLSEQQVNELIESPPTQACNGTPGPGCPNQPY